MKSYRTYHGIVEIIKRVTDGGLSYLVLALKYIVFGLSESLYLHIFILLVVFLSLIFQRMS